MGSLSECMHSCIRSASAMHSGRSIKDLRQCCLDVILDSVPVRLALPARKRPPIVCDDQKESFKSCWEELSLHRGSE
jgi:hypothetical protein